MTRIPDNKNHIYKLWNDTQLSIPGKLLDVKPEDGDQLKVTALNLRTNDELIFTGTVKYSTYKGKKVGRMNIIKNVYMHRGDMLAMHQVELIKKEPIIFQKPKRIVNIDTGEIIPFTNESGNEHRSPAIIEQEPKTMETVETEARPPSPLEKDSEKQPGGKKINLNDLW